MEFANFSNSAISISVGGGSLAVAVGSGGAGRRRGSWDCSSGNVLGTTLEGGDDGRGGVRGGGSKSMGSGRGMVI